MPTPVLLKSGADSVAGLVVRAGYSTRWARFRLVTLRVPSSRLVGSAASRTGVGRDAADPTRRELEPRSSSLTGTWPGVYCIQPPFNQPGDGMSTDLRSTGVGRRPHCPMKWRGREGGAASSSRPRD